MTTEPKATATPVYPYAYNRSEIINARIKQLMEWLELDVKSTLDEAVNRLYCREAAKRDLKPEGCPNESQTL